MNNTTINYYSDFISNSPSLFVESENLKKIIEVIMNQYQIDQEKYLWLIDNILNLEVAEKYHLDFIGQLVGQDRFLVNFNQEKYFGFLGSYQSETFNVGYWNSRSYFNTSSSRRLNDDEYRRLIKARAIYNSSTCTTDELLEVINLITDRTDNRIQVKSHGVIEISSQDTTGILAYFVEKPEGFDNILPVVAGVRIQFAESL